MCKLKDVSIFFIHIIIIIIETYDGVVLFMFVSLE